MQLLLPLPVANPYEGELVYGSANGDVVDWLKRYPDWPMQNVMVVGPEKSGKSSFARLFEKTVGAVLLDGEQSLPAVSTLEQRPIIVDNADQASEEWLFHLYNHQQGVGQPLVLFTKTDPHAWACQTKDFASRLQTFYTLFLGEPDDLMMRALLFKQLKGQGVEVSEGDLEYMLSHLERSYQAIYEICESIAHETLRLKKPLSRGLLRCVLEVEPFPCHARI